MNFADSEVVATIMSEHGYGMTDNEFDADLVFLNTCSIRDNAEQRIRHRLNALKNNKKKNRQLKVGILGLVLRVLLVKYCMVLSTNKKITVPYIIERKSGSFALLK